MRLAQEGADIIAVDICQPFDNSPAPAATSDDLQSVEGIGSMWARHIREGLSQLAESTIADRLA